jgi:hypothetical protein
MCPVTTQATEADKTNRINFFFLNHYSQGGFMNIKHLSGAIIFISIIFLPGCVSTRYSFKMVKSPTEELSIMSFTDSLIDITFQVVEGGLVNGNIFSQHDQYRGISFVLNNKTDSIITIDWNKISFKDFRGFSGNSVMHSEVKYNECSSFKPTTVVPPKGRLEDEIIPCYGVTFLGEYGWTLSFLPSPGAYSKASFGFYLPLQLGTIVKNYEFNFVANIQQTNE